MTYKNNYREAVQVPNTNLFAVRWEKEDIWSISDGPGSIDTPLEYMRHPGWHLPVVFKNRISAIQCIMSGPNEQFDVISNGRWCKHALLCGATDPTISVHEKAMDYLTRAKIAS